VFKGRISSCTIVLGLVVVIADSAAAQTSRSRNSWGMSGQASGVRRSSSSDANDGPSYPTSPTWPSSGPKPPKPQTNNNNLDWLPGLIGGIDQAVRSSQQWNQNQQPNRNNYQPQPQTNRTTRTYNPTTRATTSQPAKIVKNTAPAQNNALRNNLKLTDQGIESADKTTYSLAGDVVKKEGKEKIDELQDKLGDAATPEVQAELDKIKQKFDNNEPVTNADIDALITAVNDSGQTLPAGVTSSQLNELALDIQGLSEANEILTKPWPDNGNIPLFPSGPTGVVLFPGLPADDMVMLPDGNILTGTGGKGDIRVSTVEGSDLVDVPVGVGDPVSDVEVDVTKLVKSGTLLMNPKATGAMIHYILAKRNYSMDPGSTQTLDEGYQWVIRFDRGDDRGETTQTLSQGTYAFVVTDQGWELTRKTFGVTIDNGKGKEAFFYNVNNAQEQVEAGGQKSHTGDYPILVRFDRGDGAKEGQKKVVDQDVRYVLAVSPSDGLWDLYPGDSAGQIAGKPDAGKKSNRAARLQALLQLSGQ